jgi:soluble lytic murein transglycosylase-like protein
MKTKTMVRVYGAARSTLALFGLAALSAWLLLPLQRDSLAQQVAVAADFIDGATLAPGPIQVAAAGSPPEHEQRALAEFIAKRYRVAETSAASFVSFAYRAGVEHSVDPVLILAVMAIESRYNPVAESVVGAKGLMQVIARFHQEKLLEHGGELALLEPEINIHVGARILREYLRRFGDAETALQQYNGALDEPTSRYAQKVFAEQARLEALRQKARKPQSA